VSSENPENPATTGYPTVFFDGVCGLCSHSVNWLLARDAKHVLRFAPLQGKTAARVLSHEIRDRLDTLVFLREGKVYTRSTAVSRILMTLGGRWSVLGGLLWTVPWPIRDLGYRIVSRWRYRLFGKHDVCRLPRPEERAVFLD
jgi:predicted DCC family thiol-disulfide oxidoreductase YuxK